LGRNAVIPMSGSMRSLDRRVTNIWIEVKHTVSAFDRFDRNAAANVRAFDLKPAINAR
jgi:hypothetical protein